MTSKNKILNNSLSILMDFPSFVTQYKTYCTKLKRDRDTKLDTNGFCIYVHVYMLNWLGVGEGLLERAKERGWNLTFHGLKITCP